jgi:hypothetical protein
MSSTSLNKCPSIAPCAAHGDRSVSQDHVGTGRDGEDRHSRHNTERTRQEWSPASGRRQGEPQEEDLLKEWW